MISIVLKTFQQIKKMKQHYYLNLTITNMKMVNKKEILFVKDCIKVLMWF